MATKGTHVVNTGVNDEMANMKTFDGEGDIFGEEGFSLAVVVNNELWEIACENVKKDLEQNEIALFTPDEVYKMRVAEFEKLCV